MNDINLSDYKIVVDPAELQRKIIDYIASDELNKMVASTVFEGDEQCKLAIIHGMAIAAMLASQCTPYFIYKDYLKED